MRITNTVAGAAFALAVLGCSGAISGGDASDDPGAGGSPRGGRTAGSAGAAGAAGNGGGSGNPDFDPSYAMPLRRVSKQEFVATVRDLFGDATLDAPDYPPDSVGASGFVAAGSSFTLPDAENVADATSAIAAKVVGKLATLLPCKPESIGEDACAKQFVTKLGRRAYRRPLAAAEVDDLVAFYANARKSFALDFGWRGPACATWCARSSRNG